VAAAVPRKKSALLEVGHKIFLRIRLSSLFSHDDPIPTVFRAKIVSPKGSGQVPNKKANRAMVTS